MVSGKWEISEIPFPFNPFLENPDFDINEEEDSKKQILETGQFSKNLDFYLDKYKKNDIRYIKANVIIIEEAQFFSDLFNFVTNAADKDNKEVYVIGLDGDYLRQPFGDIVRLIPHAENIKKLKALCLRCNDGTEACFTKRIVKDNNQELVGSTDSYIAVCRKHYIN